MILYPCSLTWGWEGICTWALVSCLGREESDRLGCCRGILIREDLYWVWTGAGGAILICGRVEKDVWGLAVFARLDGYDAVEGLGWCWFASWRCWDGCGWVWILIWGLFGPFYTLWLV